MSKLQLGKTLTLPLNFLEHRKVVLGGSGTGKTAFGRVLFEEATKAGVVCGAIDLKADWWGLKSTADGKGDGIPVVIFGGEHQDVPLEEGGGAATADIVVDLRQPFIIDLENFSKGKQLRFLAVFAERLYDRNREPLVMFWDEIDRYAPQKPMSPEANVCLGAMEDIAKRGRKHGIFSTFITQRNAGLNKGVSELCDVAAVFRTPGPRDQEAVEDWFSTKATKEQRDVVMKNLAGIDTGTCVLCSAHPKLRLFETVPIRMPETFDSSATPEIGHRPIEPKRLAQPDLEKLRVRMAATIEKAKAEDPRALRAKIAQLEREIKASKLTPVTPVTPAEPTIKEVPVLKGKQLAQLESFCTKLMREAERHGSAMSLFWGNLNQVADSLLKAIKSVSQERPPLMQRSSTAGTWAAPIPRMATKILSVKPSREPGSEIVVSGSQQRILNALIWAEGIGLASLDKTQLALLADHSPTSGGYFNNLGALRTAGLIEYPSSGVARLTAAGRAQAQPVDVPTTSADLQEMLFRKLSTSQATILRVLIAQYPEAMRKDRVAEAAGQSPTSGGYFNNLGRLRSLGLIDYPVPGQVVAQPVLFLER
jgi:hypothetical protein